MLAYLSWHRAAAGIEPTAYEQALERFHRSLAHQPPSGFRGSSAFRLSNLPWLAPVAGCADAPGYEGWDLLGDWTALRALGAGAVPHGRRTAQDTIAGRAGCATGSVYRLVEGHARPARPAGGSSPDAGESDPAVWVKRTPGHEHPSLCALLGDGMDRERDGLWRRCIGLGPAPEYCLLAAESAVGVAPRRMPGGWGAA